MLDHCRPLSTILDHSRPFPTILDHSRPLSTIPDRFRSKRPKASAPGPPVSSTASLSPPHSWTDLPAERSLSAADAEYLQTQPRPGGPPPPPPPESEGVRRRRRCRAPRAHKNTARRSSPPGAPPAEPWRGRAAGPGGSRPGPARKPLPRGRPGPLRLGVLPRSVPRAALACGPRGPPAAAGRQRPGRRGGGGAGTVNREDRQTKSPI